MTAIKQNAQQTAFFTLWVLLVLAFWLFFVVVFPILGTALIFFTPLEDVVQPHVVNGTLSGYECGVGTNMHKYKCTWLLHDHEECHKFANRLGALIRGRDRDFNLGVGIGFPLIGIVNVCFMMYARRALKKYRSQVHDSEAGKTEMTSVVSTCNNEDHNSNTPDQNKDTTCKYTCKQIVTRYMHQPLHRLWGFSWERVPEVESTWKLRTKLDAVAFMSALTTFGGLVINVETWAIYYADIQGFMKGVKHVNLSDQQTLCFSSTAQNKTNLNSDAVQLMGGALLIISSLYFITTRPFAAYKKAKSCLANDNTPLEWMFSSSWSSFFSVFISAYLVIKIYTLPDVISIPEYGKVAYVVLCLLLIFTQLAESFALEYIAQLKTQGELMTSKIEVDQDDLLPSDLMAGYHEAAAESEHDIYGHQKSITAHDSACKDSHGSTIDKLQIHPQTLTWYNSKVQLLNGRLPMLLLCEPSKNSGLYHAIIQPLGARSKSIAATSFRYNLYGDRTERIKLQAGRVVYLCDLDASAVQAIKYAMQKKKYVWCDAVSVSFLRRLDPSRGEEVFNNMAMVYKFYTCIPSFNWVVDEQYCDRGWMLQEYICGELLMHDKQDIATLEKVLKRRKQTHLSSSKVLGRKQMTVKLISELLDSAMEHYKTCKITRDCDLPNACFGLLKSYGLFEKLPEKDKCLQEFANTKLPKAEFSVHPLRLLMRGLIKMFHEKKGIECAVKFAKSTKGKLVLARQLHRNRNDFMLPQKQDTSSSCHSLGVAHVESGWARASQNQE
jgi:hypothetical protein